MSFATIQQNIETLFLSDFAVEEPDVRISVPNDSFQPDNDAWIRLSINFGDVRFAALGNTLEKYIGLVQVQIFTPLKQGTAADSRIADSVSTIFRGRVDSEIYFYNTVKTVPVISDGWLQSVTSSNFRVYK